MSSLLRSRAALILLLAVLALTAILVVDLLALRRIAEAGEAASGGPQVPLTNDPAWRDATTTAAIAGAGILLLALLLPQLRRDQARRGQLERSVDAALERERGALDAAEALAAEITQQAQEAERFVRESAAARQRAEQRLASLGRDAGSRSGD